MKTISIIGSGSWARALTTLFVRREILIKYRKSVNKSKFTGKTIKFTNHFKDLNEKSKEAHDVPWGTGISDVEALVEELKRQSFEGVISVEYEYNWDNSLPEIEKSVEFFKKIAK